MTNILVVFNPSAGIASARLETVLQLAIQFRAEVIRASRSVELLDIVSESLLRGTKRIIVCGGDGSISRTVNALASHLDEIELGIVPLGTGNDLARSLDLNSLSLEEAFERAATAACIPIDLVRVSNGQNKYFVNAATGGFGAEVTASVTAAEKQHLGGFAYWFAAMTKFASIHEFNLELEVDGESLHLHSYGLTVANGRYIGGGFPMAGQALLDDGQCDLTVIPPLSTMELLLAGANYMLSGDPHAAGTLTRKARHVAVRGTPLLPFSLDGDPTRPMDVTFDVIPKSLRVVAGDRPAVGHSG